MKSFTLQVIDDNLPEVAEYIFIAITSVQLDPDSVEDVDDSGKCIQTVTSFVIAVVKLYILLSLNLL